MTTSDFVGSLAKGLEVLQVFDREHPEMTLSEVAKATGISPAAARRCLLTLKELGFVTSHERRFLLTPRVLRLSEAFLSSVSMQEVMQQFLQELADATGDSASVGVLDGTDVLYIASVPVKRSYQVTPTIGTRYPAYATSLGRAILSRSPAEVVDEVLDASPITALTAKTETDPRRLRRAIERATRAGIAGVEEELAYGVVSVAMPLLNGGGTAIAAVNCSTTPARTKLADMVKSRREPLAKAHSQISAALHQHPVLMHSVLGSGGGLRPARE
ncbi:IclR family transcriptional regulator C-terminal domain-containing protein [Nocardioides sp.]|uniref:IclR family transcriptional regulator domain-containing protein n=1 Tax=Nocardioides sp. TaxID=35761 RepID=UPI0031FF39D8|nr:Transcriptional regulator, IclR family [Nocardioides sp.]